MNLMKSPSTCVSGAPALCVITVRLKSFLNFFCHTSSQFDDHKNTEACVVDSATVSVLVAYDLIKVTIGSGTCDRNLTMCIAQMRVQMEHTQYLPPSDDYTGS